MPATEKELAETIRRISGVDTRRITRIIRDQGSQKIMITDPGTPLEEAVAASSEPWFRERIYKKLNAKLALV